MATEQELRKLAHNFSQHDLNNVFHFNVGNKVHFDVKVILRGTLGRLFKVKVSLLNKENSGTQTFYFPVGMSVRAILEDLAILLLTRFKLNLSNESLMVSDLKTNRKSGEEGSATGVGSGFKDVQFYG